MRVLLFLLWFAGIGAAFAQSGEARLKKELERTQKYLSELTSKEQVLSKKKSSLTDGESASLYEVRYLLPLVKAEEARWAGALRDLREGVDTTADIKSICPVHRREMKVIFVPIEHGEGFNGPSNPSPQVRMKLFPFARDTQPGGCIILDTSPTRAKVYRCEACLTAFQAWVKDAGLRSPR